MSMKNLTVQRSRVDYSIHISHSQGMLRKHISASITYLKSHAHSTEMLLSFLHVDNEKQLLVQ